MDREHGAVRRGLDDRVLALLEAGRKEQYLTLMESLVRDSPDDGWVRLHYATALSLTRPDQAPAEVRAAVALAPEDPVILTLAAARMFELGEFDESQEYVTRAGQLVRLSEFVLGTSLVHTAGQLAARRGDTERARALLKAAVDAGPDDLEHARFAKSYARFLAQLGEVQAAKEGVRSVLDQHPNDDGLRAMSATEPQLPE